MVRLRLKRLGRKKRPFYRIVAIDVRARRQGAPISELGYYNPISKELKLDKPAALKLISQGAQPSETVKRLIDRADDSGNLIVLETVRKEKLSKKAQARIDKEAADKAAAKEAEAKAKEEAAAAAKAAAEAPAAEEAAPAEEPAAE